MSNLRKRRRMTGMYHPREMADRLAEHKAKLESKNYLKEVGCVYSIREESGGLGRRPNECDKNNHMDEKNPICKTIKIQLWGRLVLFYAKGYYSTDAESCILTP